VALAESKLGEDDPRERRYFDALQTCGQCRQRFGVGEVNVALSRAAWLRCAGRAETDHGRQISLLYLSSALVNHATSRDCVYQSIFICEELVATLLRLYGPDDAWKISAEELLAKAFRRVGGEGNLRRGLQTLERTYAWKVQHWGLDDIATIRAAGFLANALRDVGKISDATSLWRETVLRMGRILGETHFSTLQGYGCLAELLVFQNQIDEASEIRERILPVVTLMLGPEHEFTRYIGRPDFLARASFTISPDFVIV